MKIDRTASAIVAGTAALTLVLAGCSADNEAATATESASSAASSVSSEATATDGITLSDAYIKEKPAEKEMTGIFGTFKNNTDKEVALTGFKLEGLPEDVKFEIHDTKDGAMFPVKELKIPAGGELKLQPGGQHLMVMNIKEAMEAGAEYKLVVEFSDGSTVTQTVPVRVQQSGEENYGQNGELVNPTKEMNGEMNHGEMDHGEMGHE